MYNERTEHKGLYRLLLLIVSAGIIVSCGPTAEEKAAQERKDLGESLFAEINNAMNAKDYHKVITLCDSLDEVCPDQTELREKALSVWTEARYEVLLDSADILDVQIDSLTNRMTALMPDFVKVEISPGLEGYRIPKSIAGGTPIVARTGIEPRLGGEDDLWTLVVNVTGSKPSITGLRFTDGKGSIVETLADNAIERRATETSGEMMSFKAEEMETIASALSQADLSGAKFEIIGVSRNIPVNLTPQLAAAITETWEMATLREKRQSLLKQRELISRKIQLADSQRKNMVKKQD